MVISPSRSKGHIAFLWPFCAFLCLFELLGLGTKYRYILAHKEAIQDRGGTGGVGITVPKAAPQPQLMTMMGSNGEPSGCRATEVGRVPVYLSSLPGGSRCHVPTAGRLPGSEATRCCLPDLPRPREREEGRRRMSAKEGRHRFDDLCARIIKWRKVLNRIKTTSPKLKLGSFRGRRRDNLTINCL